MWIDFLFVEAADDEKFRSPFRLTSLIYVEKFEFENPAIMEEMGVPIHFFFTIFKIFNFYVFSTKIKYL